MLLRSTAAKTGSVKGVAGMKWLRMQVKVIVIDVLTILDLFEMFGVIELQVLLSIDIAIRWTG
jgi:hypothetical protein